MTDRELLQELARTGREDMLALAISRHSDMVYSVCLRMLADRHAAEDAAQATFILLWRKRSQLSPDTILPGWLYQTSRQVAMTAIRARARRVRHEQEAAKMRTELPITPPEAAWTDVQPHLDAAMAALPRRQRDALVLRFLRGCDVEEMASQLRCSRDSARSLVRRAIERLRGKLGKGGATVGAAALAGMMATEAVQAAPASLAASIHAACLGTAAATTPVLALVKETTMAMFVAKVKVLAATAAAAVVALSVVGTGVYPVLAADPVPKPAATSPAATNPDAPKAVPLGHKDFYPSPQQPVGFRGNGNGCFPGATPVTEFWDGTPAQVDRPLMTESFGKALDLKGKTTAKVWDVTDEKSKNIVWKTRLPGWSLADPIVVGDRVFAVGEPDWLTCADAHSGKVIWQTRVLPLFCDGKTPEEAARLQQVIDIAAAFWIVRGQHGESLFSRSLSSTEAVTVPMTAKLVERLPVWRKTIQDADNDPKLLEAFDRSAAAIANRANANFDRRLLGTFVDAVEKKYRVPVGTEWYGHVGVATSTPVSDGERVYVTYCQGQVAAYDLDGHLVWAKRFAEWFGNKNGFINTPLLCDQVLIVNSPNGSKYRALNTRTGELLWERKEGSHWMPARVVRLRTAQGEAVNAVLYPKSRQIRRLEDDRVLGEVPVTFKDPGPTELAGFQWLVHHDRVMFAPGPYLDRSAAFIYRLRATATDRVDVEKVYEMPKGRVIVGANHLATTPEYVLFGGTKGLPLHLQPFGDPITLENTAIATAIPCGQNIVAGKTIFSLFDADGGNNAWFRGARPDPGGQGGQGRPTDRKAMVRIVTADISNPAAVRILGDRNLLQETGPASDIYVEQYLLNGMDPFLFAGCYHGSASFFGGLMGSMTPSGNRLFIQSATHLRCIGDPAVKYDWNPQSRPAHITNAMKTKTPSTKEP